MLGVPQLALPWGTGWSPVSRWEMLALGPWSPPSMGRGELWIPGVDGHMPVLAEDGTSQEVWGAEVWWAQGREGREVGVQFGSGTIWAANASVWHAAAGEALHTWLHCVRSGGRGGWGRGWCPAVPWELCCPLQAGSRAWVTGRGKRIRVADLLSLFCSLP